MVGVDNDYYLNTISGDVFQKQSGVWVKIGNFMGPKGDTGSKGDKGDTGAAGPMLYNGTVDPT